MTKAVIATYVLLPFHFFFFFLSSSSCLLSYTGTQRIELSLSLWNSSCQVTRWLLSGRESHFSLHFTWEDGTFLESVSHWLIQLFFTCPQQEPSPLIKRWLRWLFKQDFCKFILLDWRLRNSISQWIYAASATLNLYAQLAQLVQTLAFALSFSLKDDRSTATYLTQTGPLQQSSPHLGLFLSFCFFLHLNLSRGDTSEAFEAYIASCSWTWQTGGEKNGDQLIETRGKQLKVPKSSVTLLIWWWISCHRHSCRQVERKSLKQTVRGHSVVFRRVNFVSHVKKNFLILPAQLVNENSSHLVLHE